MECDLLHIEIAILYFTSNFAYDMCFFHYLLIYVARECVTMVTNHTVTFKIEFSTITKQAR